MAEFVPLFAHPRLTADAYAAAVSRWFDRGIEVPIVIFADPTGREIPGTRLDHVQAQVKANVLASARKALAAFRGGQDPAKAKESWAALGRALRLRAAGKDPGAAVEDMVALRASLPKGGSLRESLDELLRRLDEEEAAGMVDIGAMDLEGEEPRAGIDQLFQVLREFPGLPSAARAGALLAEARKDAALAGPVEEAEKGHRGWLALRAADRLHRAGKGKEAVEAWKKVATDFPGTEAGKEAAARKP